MDIWTRLIYKDGWNSSRSTPFQNFPVSPFSIKKFDDQPREEGPEGSNNRYIEKDLKVTEYTENEGQNRV